jgi:nucleoid DNA-binding protein
MENDTLVAELSAELHRNPRDIEALIEGLASALRDALADGDTVLLPGFGTFATVKEDEKVVDDLAGGSRLLLPPCISVKFNPSTLLRRKITERP